jgi:hypothetical protein
MWHDRRGCPRGVAHVALFSWLAVLMAVRQSGAGFAWRRKQETQQLPVSTNARARIARQPTQYPFASTVACLLLCCIRVSLALCCGQKERAVESHWENWRASARCSTGRPSLLARILLPLSSVSRAPAPASASAPPLLCFSAAAASRPLLLCLASGAWPPHRHAKGTQRNTHVPCATWRRACRRCPSNPTMTVAPVLGVSAALSSSGTCGRHAGTVEGTRGSKGKLIILPDNRPMDDTNDCALSVTPSTAVSREPVVHRGAPKNQRQQQRPLRHPCSLALRTRWDEIAGWLIDVTMDDDLCRPCQS